MATYGSSDFPGVTVNTKSNVEPPQWLSIHIDSADPDMLPLKLALEENWEVYIYGPDERADDIREMVQELQEDHFKFAQGVVTP